MLEGKKMRRVFFLHIILVVIGFNLNLLLKLSLYPPITTITICHVGFFVDIISFFFIREL